MSNKSMPKFDFETKRDEQKLYHFYVRETRGILKRLQTLLHNDSPRDVYVRDVKYEIPTHTDYIFDYQVKPKNYRWINLESKKCINRMPNNMTK